MLHGSHQEIPRFLFWDSINFSQHQPDPSWESNVPATYFASAAAAAGAGAAGAAGASVSTGAGDSAGAAGTWWKPATCDAVSTALKK